MPAQAPVAIETIGLTKRFGSTVAVEDLDLTVPPGEVFGFLGPTAPVSRPRSACCSECSARPPVMPGFSATTLPMPRQRPASAYVPADVALWPSLTGAESLELLANLGPGVDRTYRDI